MLTSNTEDTSLEVQEWANAKRHRHFKQMEAVKVKVWDLDKEQNEVNSEDVEDDGVEYGVVPYDQVLQQFGYFCVVT